MRVATRECVIINLRKATNKHQVNQTLLPDAGLRLRGVLFSPANRVYVSYGLDVNENFGVSVVALCGERRHPRGLKVGRSWFQ